MDSFIDKLSIKMSHDINMQVTNYCDIGNQTQISKLFNRGLYVPQHDNVKTLTSLAIWGGGGGASIIRLGPYWFTSTLSFIMFILIYISNMEAI